ncbi:hypothetical protein CBM2633_B10271 [Cupriavidus taiwanensis]|nr:hypothetical protein CBM2633_B10271 [Cupriavidus taiwanensis]
MMARLDLLIYHILYSMPAHGNLDRKPSNPPSSFCDGLRGYATLR